MVLKCPLKDSWSGARNEGDGPGPSLRGAAAGSSRTREAMQLGETSQTEKDQYCLLSRACGTKRARVVKAE